MSAFHPKLPRRLSTNANLSAADQHRAAGTWLKLARFGMNLPMAVVVPPSRGGNCMSDDEYFAQRAAAEARLAEEASDERAAAVHKALAREYSKRAGDGQVRKRA